LECGSLVWQGSPCEFFDKPDEFFARMSFARPPVVVLRDLLVKSGAVQRGTPPDIRRIREALCL